MMKHFRIPVFLVTILVLMATVLPAGSALAEDGIVADDGEMDTFSAKGPVASGVLLAPNPAVLNDVITVTATVDNIKTSNSIIQSAAFNVNGGSWIAMTAADGVFDTTTEVVTGSFPATSIGTYKVCVRGINVLGKIGKKACAPLTVQSVYTFKGFKSPLAMGKINKANARRAIPLKWNLTLTSDGSVVSDPASFVAVKSYGVDCTTLAGDISTAVDENGPGKTKLTYTGKGNWKFNWKTFKAYRHTCRMMFVLFSDGAMSPQVVFKFK
jgi:hypothetical protein